MAERTLRIATRKSALAVWQAEHVAEQLQAHHPELAVELVRMSTQGDRIQDAPLARIGGKGLFLKELEEGLLDGRADIAVHSLKDVPAVTTPELHLPVVARRGDPRDAFLSPRYPDLAAVPSGGVVGSASLRRQCQIRAARPDVRVETLRGSVNTRLAKLERGDFDAIILAASGLQRLAMDDQITRLLSPEESLPAVGQGALAIQCRTNDTGVEERIAALDDSDSHTRVAAERAMNRELEGSCQVPIGAYAELAGSQLHLRGMVGEPDGSRVVAGAVSGDRSEAEALGTRLGHDLLERGAREILERLFAEGDEG